MKLYHVLGFRSSKVVWLYKELRLLYPSTTALPPLNVHTLEAESFRREKPAWFLKINPNGKVPVLEDDSSSEAAPIFMWDSIAICFYLLEKFDTKGLLAPKSDVFRSQMYQWGLSVIPTNLLGPYLMLITL